jgi:membrane fusion protein, multidrug efflux system
MKLFHRLADGNSPTAGFLGRPGCDESDRSKRRACFSVVCFRLVLNKPNAREGSRPRDPRGRRCCLKAAKVITVALQVLAAGGVALLSSCSKSNQAAEILSSPPEVLITDVVQKDVPVIREWIGSLDGSVNADIRARVSGYVTSLNYKEGGLAQKGDLLFQIDPTTYEAALEQAKAALTQAQANQVQTEQTEKREIQLYDEKVESAQNRDNAIQANSAAKAEVKAQEAAVRQAEINLEFTKIVAPVTGIVGISTPGIGDLVGPSDAQPLTTISTVDPIKVYFQVSEQDYLKAAESIHGDKSNSAASVPIRMILSNGELYSFPGTFSAADRQVDQQSGTIRLVALFPNPNNILRPGQFVRVQVTTRTIAGALLVPQRAVTELQGEYQVVVVDSENKAQVRSVKVGDRVGSLWVVMDGLKLDEHVVVEGAQKVRDGQTVKSSPWSAPAG